MLPYIKSLFIIIKATIYIMTIYNKLPYMSIIYINEIRI